MAAYRTLLVSQEDAVLRIRLNRPEVRNAFNPEMIRELLEVFSGPGDQASGRSPPAADAAYGGLRAVSLEGEGGTFCSGGDLAWMESSLDFSPAENLEDAQALSRLFEAMDTFPLPVICSVEGFALGGGVGLVSAADYALATEDARFSLSEVKVGLIPACIGPFVLKKIGPSHARALFLSGERFGAERALRIGLVHEVLRDASALSEARERVLQGIRTASPRAVRLAKVFLRDLASLPHGEQGKLASRTLADLRVTPEAQEGIRAFLEKRPPRWIGNK